MFIIEELIEKRKIELINFINIMYLDIPNYEYKRILMYENIPFRDSEDMYWEAGMISGFYKIDIPTYYDMLRILYEHTNYYNYQVVEDLKRFCEYEIVGLETLYSDFRIGGNKLYPFEDRKIIESNLKKYYYLPNSVDRSHSIGHFAELVVYDKLIKEPNKEIKWVSREVGDGFGYDFLVRDLVTNHYDFIEVKGRTTGLNVELSDNESNKFMEINELYNDSTYHIYVVPISINEDDIYYDIVDLYYFENLLRTESYANISYRTNISSDIKYNKFVLER